jgi:hypothetical protein
MFMKHIVGVCLLGLVWLGLPSIGRGQILLNETFDDDAVGSRPNTVDFHLGENPPGTGSDMEVVGPGSTYTDPFGPVGNHSYVFDNFNGGSNAAPGGVQYPVAAWSDELGLPGTKYREGTVSFDLYLKNDVVNGVDEKFWTYMDLRLGFDTGYPNTVADTIIYGNFRIQDGIGYYFFDNTTGPTSGHPTRPDTIHHVIYTILPDETYTLQVDGAFVQKDGSQFVPWRTRGANAGFNVLGIASAFGPGGLTNNPFYIDNLIVSTVPEPGITGIVMLLTLGGILLRRRA